MSECERDSVSVFNITYKHFAFTAQTTIWPYKLWVHYGLINNGYNMALYTMGTIWPYKLWVQYGLINYGYTMAL